MILSPHKALSQAYGFPGLSAYPRRTSVSSASPLDPDYAPNPTRLSRLPLLISMLDNAKSLRLDPVPGIPSAIQPSMFRPPSMPTVPQKSPRKSTFPVAAPAPAPLVGGLAPGN
ncbi:hypothetical protein G7Z17_g12578 [Cylindrodendrum hubeiense]|uniref:Uncharacterized protein n=1 Tax=Cylindrodendrum hubeiense TaxID=595255 RepID=A0A9P5GY25_9HYPO|nr:hypothetical protein G7Z17_g12578 [Cylindrodendrum hubeiense]